VLSPWSLQDGSLKPKDTKRRPREGWQLTLYLLGSRAILCPAPGRCARQGAHAALTACLSRSSGQEASSGRGPVLGEDLLLHQCRSGACTTH
jgi:hypothetical protein